MVYPVFVGYARRTAITVFARVVRDREMLRLDLAIFALHAIVTASFLALQAFITGTLRVRVSEKWLVYIPVHMASIVPMSPTINFPKKRAQEVPIWRSLCLLRA